MASNFTAVARASSEVVRITADANMDPAEDKVEELKKTFTTLIRALEEGNKKEKHNDNKKFPLSKQRGIEKVPAFSGVRGEFLNWARRVEVFCSDDLTLKDLLKMIKKSEV